MGFPQPTYFGRNRYWLLSHLFAWEAERAARGRVAAFIVKNRPLADLYVRKDYMGHFRIRVQLESGQRYVITIREE